MDRHMGVLPTGDTPFLRGEARGSMLPAIEKFLPLLYETVLGESDGS